jgi:calcium binding protein 39
MMGPETEVSPEQQFQLINALLADDILLLLANSIHKIPFEARKDTQFIFSSAFRYKHPTAPAQEPIALHHILTARPQIVIALCNGYEKRESAMPCGGVLREALKYDAVAALILYDEKNEQGQARDLAEVDTAKPSSGQGAFWKFFDWITKSSFDVCTDAFNTFRVCFWCISCTASHANYLPRKSSPNTKRWSLRILKQTLTSSSQNTTGC